MPAKAFALRFQKMSVAFTASTVPAKVLMIQAKTMIQVSMMTQVNTEQSHN